MKEHLLLLIFIISFFPATARSQIDTYQHKGNEIVLFSLENMIQLRNMSPSKMRETLLPLGYKENRLSDAIVFSVGASMGDNENSSSRIRIHPTKYIFYQE